MSDETRTAGEAPMVVDVYLRVECIGVALQIDALRRDLRGKHPYPSHLGTIAAILIAFCEAAESSYAALQALLKAILIPDVDLTGMHGPAAARLVIAGAEMILSMVEAGGADPAGDGTDDASGCDLRDTAKRPGEAHEAWVARLERDFPEFWSALTTLCADCVSSPEAMASERAAQAEALCPTAAKQTTPSYRNECVLIAIEMDNLLRLHPKGINPFRRDDLDIIAQQLIAFCQAAADPDAAASALSMTMKIRGSLAGGLTAEAAAARLVWEAGALMALLTPPEPAEAEAGQ